MTVIVTTGDGDCYGEGGNHLMAAMRRNINVKLFVHDNQIYGLTKGQPSPTTGEGMVTKNVPFGVIAGQFNPLALGRRPGLQLRGACLRRRHGASQGDDEGSDQPPRLLARGHPAALRDLHKVNTFDWYRQRVYKLGPDHNAADRTAAFTRALEWGDRIPLGVIYRNERPTFEERFPALTGQPIVRQQAFQTARLEKTVNEFS